MKSFLTLVGMPRQFLVSISSGVVPFFISAIFFYDGQTGAGVLCLAIGSIAVGFATCRSGHICRRVILGGGTLAWMSLIFYLSSLTQPETPQVPLLGNWQSLVGHLVLYGICAALMEGSLWSWVSGFRLRWTLVATMGATTYGISDEFHQSFVAGRHATVEDVLVNTIAAIVAAVGLWLIAKRWGNRISWIEEYK